MRNEIQANRQRKYRGPFVLKNANKARSASGEDPERDEKEEVRQQAREQTRSVGQRKQEGHAA
jgi:hypothetical protein